MGTLVFWGGHSIWEGLSGACVSGPKALVHPLGAPCWGVEMLSGGRVLLGGWVGPAPSRLVLLSQTVAPGGSPTGPRSGPPRTTRKDLSTHHQSQGLPHPGCRRSWSLLPRGWARDGSRGWVADGGVT